MTRLEKNEFIARLLGWYQINGAWIHPDGYAKPLPDFVGLLEEHGYARDETQPRPS